MPADPSPMPGTRSGLGRFGRVLVIRLGPGEDLLGGLDREVAASGIGAGVILSGLASLHHLRVRNITRFPERWPITPDMREVTTIPGPLEVLSMQGTLTPTPDGGSFTHCHVEVSLGSPPAATHGGHLIEGTTVATTAEIVVAELVDLAVARIHDPETEALEIDVTPRLDPADPPTTS